MEGSWRVLVCIYIYIDKYTYTHRLILVYTIQHRIDEHDKNIEVVCTINIYILWEANRTWILYLDFSRAPDTIPI